MLFLRNEISLSSSEAPSASPTVTFFFSVVSWKVSAESETRRSPAASGTPPSETRRSLERRSPLAGCVLRLCFISSCAMCSYGS